MIRPSAPRPAFIAGLLLVGLTVAAGCSDDAPPDDMAALSDAHNDATCPSLADNFNNQLGLQGHKICNVDRDCEMVKVSCCLDPHGQVVVNFEAFVEISNLARSYDQHCPEPCACDTSSPGFPGCVRGSQVCGYN